MIYTFIVGFATGVLALMQVQVIVAWNKRRTDPYFLNPHFIPMEQRLQDWDTAELDEPVPFVPTPRSATPLQECPQCGRGFKRVATHITMAHKVKVEDE